MPGNVSTWLSGGGRQGHSGEGLERAMTITPSLLTYLFAAGVLTITPGVDTVMVLRTATLEGPRRAAFAALGIGLGCLVWGALVALGLGALLAASEVAFTGLKLSLIHI